MLKGIIVAILFVIALIAAICVIYSKMQNTANNVVKIDKNNIEINDNEYNDAKDMTLNSNSTDKNIADDNNLGDENINNIDSVDKNEQKDDIKIENDDSTIEKGEYVFGEKVPESEAVEDSYFDDAVFIGNSQIEGITIYTSMKNATVLAGKGIMVDTIFSKEVIKTDNGKRITIMDALSKEKYSKIYIMLGANELGWAFDYLFIDQYAKVVDEIKKLQPDAKIYINGVMPVSKEKSSKDKIYNNQNIDNYNNLILNMTKEKEVYYIDSKEALADSEGNLPKDAGSDGVHLNATYYEKWFDYLKTHTVN